MHNKNWLASASTVLGLLTGALAAVPTAQAQAVLPFGTLTFTTPTGAVLNTEVVEVGLRLTLDASSPALSFSSQPLTGFDPSVIPANGYYYPPNGDPRELRPFASVSSANLNVFAGCSGTFIANCTPGVNDYTFDFNYGANSVIGLNNANVLPGGTLDFVIGSFTPKAGGATPGVYDFSVAGLTLEFVGLDASGNFLFTDGELLAGTCPTCDFTRTVSAVPEPQTYALMLLGLLGVGGYVGRRRVS
jgi:PEP-CTERM motif